MIVEYVNVNVNRQVEECLWNCFEKNHLGPLTVL